MAIVAVPQKNPIVDIYVSVLQFLSDKDKLELVSRLTASMAEKSDKEKLTNRGLRNAFHGDWGVESDYADVLRKESVAEVREVNAW